MSAERLLQQIALAVPILLDGLAGRLDGREEILDRMTAFLADLVTKLESLDFANAPHTDSVLVCTARTRSRGRDDSSRIVILRRLGGRILDDILGDAVRPTFRILLTDVTSDSSQLVILMGDSVDP